MDPGNLFHIITNSTLLATRLLSNKSLPRLRFLQILYCISLPEDAPRDTLIGKVEAVAGKGVWSNIQYDIRDGNKEGIFSIDTKTGEVSLALDLDYEREQQYTLKVAAISGSDVAWTWLRVMVEDVNDNPPKFLSFVESVAVIEEDDRNLPTILTQFTATDEDSLGHQNLLYTIEGDGVEEKELSELTFLIHPSTGELLQFRSLDRDPPNGKPVWKLKIRVFDGQTMENNQVTDLDTYLNVTQNRYQSPTFGSTAKIRSKRWENNHQAILHRNLKEDASKNSFPNGSITGSFWCVENSSIHDINDHFTLNTDSINRIRPLIAKNQKDLYKKYFRSFSTFANKKATVVFNPHEKTVEEYFSTFLANYKKCGYLCVLKNSNVLNRFNPKIYFNVPFLFSPNYLYDSGEVKRKLTRNYERNFTSDQFPSNVGNKYPYMNGVRKQVLLHLAKAFAPRQSTNGRLFPIKIISRSRPNETRTVRTKSGIERSITGEKSVAQIVSNWSSFRGRLRRSPITNNNVACPSIHRPLRTQSPYKIHVIERQFTVFVKDINDNRPKFSRTTYFMNVKENGEAEEIVGKVTAFDHDDVTFGTNALLTYSLEKNVVEEHTGERLFKIDPSSGEIRTALCCFDRELAAAYRLQAVATDGGGLQGTATILVDVLDENDNPPRFAREERVARVAESFGLQRPKPEVLVDAPINDPDRENQFFCRIIQSSGNGWHLFDVTAEERSCSIRAAHTLDFENIYHRNGFKFKIQVSDQGDINWVDPRHTDTSWIRIFLEDVNDNAPSFNASSHNVTIREDIRVGTKIINLTATDKDSEAHGEITYSLDDPYGCLRIDSSGTIWVGEVLNRESPVGPQAQVVVRATDQGSPPLTGTTLLSVTLADVNDCPPVLASPPGGKYHIKENTPSSRIGILMATDADDAHLSHGSPFIYQLAQISPKSASQDVTLKLNSRNKNGGAEIWSLRPLDREEQSPIFLDVQVTDSAGLSANQRVEIIVDDVNDNQMSSGAKIIHVLKPQTLVSDFRLGRVFVEDLDDWDLADKTFEWIGEPHREFVLNRDSGDIYASTNLPDGRYDLHFNVSDHFWQEFNVSSTVSIFIKSLPSEMFIHAVPIALLSVSPKDLVKDWSPEGKGGLLGFFLQAVRQSLADVVDDIVLISVEEQPKTIFNYGKDDPESSCKPAGTNGSHMVPPTFSSFEASKLWLVASDGNSFMDSVKFKGLLELTKSKISYKTSLIFSLEEVDHDNLQLDCRVSSTTHSFDAILPQYNSSFSVPRNFQMQVVDINSSSLVTAILSPSTFLWSMESSVDASPNFSNPVPLQPLFVASSSGDRETSLCTKGFCLNGGRCVPTATASKCICPGDTVGPRCKIISRTFWKNGWAWLPRLPTCLPLRISLQLLAHEPNGLILYQGPLSKDQYYSSDSSKFILIVQLKLGLPVLTLQQEKRNLYLAFSRNESIADGKWHSLHLDFTKESVSMMLDFCAPKTTETSTWHSSSCFTTFKMPRKWKWKRMNWASESPLQIGGSAVVHLNSEPSSVRPNGFRGCISRLNVKGQLIDLGEPIHSSNSKRHCIVDNERLCDQLLPSSWDIPTNGVCKTASKCSERVARHPKSQFPCDCIEGATSHPICGTPMHPVTLEMSSYSSFALSFVPDPQRVSVRVKFKTRSRDGLLVLLSSKKASLSLSLHISGGYLCLSFSTSSYVLRRKTVPTVSKEASFSPSIDLLNFTSLESTISRSLLQDLHANRSKSIQMDPSENAKLVCITKRRISDGTWHSVLAARLGHNLVIQVDAGEAWQFNETLPLFETKAKLPPPLNFWVDIREGVFVGGVPEYIKRNVSLVFHDLKQACLGDLKISGHRLPLPPVVNSTHFGQVTTVQKMTRGCTLNLREKCRQNNCLPPLQCHEVQGQPVCGCQTGKVFTPSGCHAMDLCLFNPCFNGGTCRRTEEGFSCLCPPECIGRQCEWTTRVSLKEDQALPVVISLSLVIIGFGLLALVCFIYILKRIKMMKRKESQKRTSPSLANTKKVKDFANLHDVHVKTIHEFGSFSSQDDLRNYAYEGKGSSAESLGSVFKGIQNEIGDPLENRAMVPSICEVIDLLKELADAAPSISKSRSKIHGGEALKNC